MKVNLAKVSEYYKVVFFTYGGVLQELGLHGIQSILNTEIVLGGSVTKLEIVKVTLIHRDGSLDILANPCGRTDSTQDGI